MFNQDRFNEELIICNRRRFREDKFILGLCYTFVVLVFLVLVSMIHGCETAYGESFTTEASYYTVASCLAESGQCMMANGKVLRDEIYTCASWDFPFGTQLRVTKGNKSVVVTVSDRGPNKRLYRQGRKLDLSQAAFGKLASLKQGVIKVTYEVI